MKLAAQITAAGVAALFVIPIIGLVMGVLALLLKIALVMVLGYFVLTLLKRVRGGEEVEIEVEVEEID